MGASHSTRNRGGNTVTSDDPRENLRAHARGEGRRQQQQQQSIRTELRFVPDPMMNTANPSSFGNNNNNNNNNDGVITKKTSTIRNHVNVKKSSVFLSMEKNAIEFTYDATKKCVASVYVSQKGGWMMGSSGKFISVAHRKPCEAGFSETVSVAVDANARFSLRSLTNNQENDGFAVIIQLECVGDQVETQEEANRVLFGANEDHEEERKEGEGEQREYYFDPSKAFESVDASIQAQTTYCSVPQSLSTTEENLVKLQVVKQHIFVNGNSYELQEIYGIESNNNNNNNNSLEQQHNMEQFQMQQQQEEDDEIMCVVCLSEPKDTTVLPCRHMCMCSECARALRFQSNKCPICRNPVESLLEISISNNNDENDINN
jgi:hypothetical protein